MKANELMVGDWVRMPFGLPEIRQIKYTSEIDDADFYEPIPLTTEILERNGFKEISGDDDIYQLEEKPFWFWVDFMNHQYGCEFDTSTYECESSEHRLKLYGIPSVNELQHALKLCGIEKNIEL